MLLLTLCIYAIIELTLCLYAIIESTLCLYAIIVLTLFLSLGRHLTLAVHFAPVPAYRVLCNFLFEFQLMNSRRFSKAACLVSITFSRCCSWKIQTHQRLKKTRYLLGPKHNLQIFGVIPFIKLQNDTQTTLAVILVSHICCSWNLKETAPNNAQL